MNWFTLLNIAFAALTLIEGLLNEPVGGPSVAAPAVNVTFDNKTFAVVVSASRTA